MQIVSHILGDTFELGPRKRLPLGRRWDDQVVGGGGTRDLIKSHSSRGVRVRRFAWALFFFFPLPDYRRTVRGGRPFFHLILNIPSTPAAAAE